MVCESELVVKVATAEMSRAFVPKSFVPSKKVTSPVGVPPPGATALKVAVKVTFDPGNAGFADEVIVLVVLAGVMLALIASALLASVLLVLAFGLKGRGGRPVD